MSYPHLHTFKSCPEKSRPIKYGGPMHGAMIAIEYNYKLDRKNILIDGANQAGFCSDSHIWISNLDSTYNVVVVM